MSYDAGWCGKWVNNWGRWFIDREMKHGASPVPSGVAEKTSEKPLLWVVENGQAKPLARDRRMGFKP
jgi:hypothetical protein